MEPNAGVPYANAEPLGMRDIGCRHTFSGRRVGDTWHVKTQKGWNFKFNAITYKDE